MVYYCSHHSIRVSLVTATMIAREMCNETGSDKRSTASILLQRFLYSNACTTKLKQIAVLNCYQGQFTGSVCSLNHVCTANSRFSSAANDR